MRPAVFLDRDDTLIRNSDLDPMPGLTPGDLIDPLQIEPLPGALEACRLLFEAAFTLVVVTNQGVVARGGGTLGDLEACNDRLLDLFEGAIAAVYACPLHPRGALPHFTTEHPWRKPGSGMIQAASHELGLDLERSWLVGDAERDVEAGHAAGLAAERCIRVGSGETHSNLMSAATHILRSTNA
ncbi:MAG: HAD-IIIA family hydrolase [Planctomycetota bacterium]